MVVLSLFNGMSCGEIALRQIGITPDIYYSSEIDKHAIAQTQLNFPNTIQLGSVVDINVSDLQPIDLLIGGSPCQSFSFAGKRKGMATKSEIQITKLEQYLELKEQAFEFEGQSYLFWEYMRILTDTRKYNPEVKFLLENVEMGSKWERILSEAIGIYGVHINSALVSAQNRKRIYWTNIQTKEVGLFGELHANIPQPKDKGILLKDILESEVDEKYYLSEKFNNWLEKHAAKRGVEVKHLDGSTKASCLTVTEAKRNLSNDYIVAMRGRNPDNPSDRRTGSPTEQRLEPNLSGKTNCLTSVQKDNLVITPCDYRHDEGIRMKADGKTGTLLGRARNDESCGQLVQENIICHNTMPRSSTTGKGGTGPLSRNDGKTYCLDTGQTNAIEIQTSRIRRLTPIECARLQTVPDWYKWGCSDTQIYKMCGNGWTVDIIAHIFSFLK